ncbi:MAG: glycosyltransferase family 2 protein, partial [Chloroflexota bacterium]
MDRIGSPSAGHFTRIAPRQILAHERGFAITIALAFFALATMPLWSPLLMPTAAAYILLLYNIYWAAQALYSSLAGLTSYRRMQAWTKVDWRAYYDVLGQTVQQVVVLPNYRERIEVMRDTLERLAQSDYPCAQLNVVLAMEAREDDALAKAEQLRAQFAGRFGHFWITAHPLAPDETAGKGANLTYAVRYVQRQADELGWDAARVMITTIDADTRLHPQYLAALAVQFWNAPNRTRKFFQGVLLLLNNVWDVHAPIRVFSAFWSFTYLTGVTHYQRMTTAVYSMSLRLLDDAGYWDPRVVAEDGHIFFRAFFALRGTVDIEPIYLPISLNAVQSRDLWQALRQQYRQMMRWTWTASNLPFIADQWRRHTEIPLARKIKKCLPYFEGLLVLPASWYIITFGVLLLPLINSAAPLQVFGLPLTMLAPLILSPTAVGVVVALGINLKLRAQYAPRPRPVSRRYRVAQWAEWLLLLFAAVVYFGVPYA